MHSQKIWGIILCLTMLSCHAHAQLAANPWGAQGTPKNFWNVQTPTYVGENSTWTKAQGQREIAPDVNITNMLLMTQHLRNLGYKIPDGLDVLITTAPVKLRQQIWASMRHLRNSSHPVATVSVSFAEIFEKQTGFSIHNLIDNSLRLIDQRR